MDKHSRLLRSELGILQGMQAKISVPQDAQPRFYKPRPVAYSLKHKVEEEQDRLQKEGVIKQVQFSDWAAINSYCYQKIPRSTPPLIPPKDCFSMRDYLSVYHQPLLFSSVQWKAFYKIYLEL